ncbi:hypothetical protein Tco_0606297 [Tanacetum coccineum]
MGLAARSIYLRGIGTLQETVWMVEEEAYASREAWANSIRLSQATHQELQTHHDHVYAHETHLQAHQTQLQLKGTLIQTQHRERQAQMVETLRVIRDMRREMSDMQAELLALREQQRRARQPRPEARIPDHQMPLGMLTVPPPTSSDLSYFILLDKSWAPRNKSWHHDQKEDRNIPHDNNTKPNNMTPEPSKHD